MSADVFEFHRPVGRPLSPVNEMRRQEAYAHDQATQAPTPYIAQMWRYHATNCARIIKELERK